MKIRYTAGPPRVDMGMAGGFKINEFRDIPDEMAQRILAKTSLVWEAEKQFKVKSEK
jgi:hypothetical protein